MRFFPSSATGTIKAPPSKSMAHRFLICAALSKGTSIISNIDLSEDIKATISCLQQLGANISIKDNVATVTGSPASLFSRSQVELNCNESGSTLRFFIPLAMLSGESATFTGSKTLLSRPLSVYEQICNEQKLTFNRKEDSIFLQGKLKSGVFTIPGNISSQFITGLLLALPLLEGDSKIILTQSVESKPYILMTQQALNTFGITTSWENENTISIKGNQNYKAKDLEVEGDFSNAAFFDVFNYLGGKVQVTGLDKQSLQGDKIYSEVFEQLKQNKGDSLLDISDCPDLGPILFSVAAALNGGTFTGTARLKIKESDRGAAMCQELAKFGVETVMESDRISIKKCELHAPAEVILGHNDHRIVMALCTLLTITGGSITGTEAVKKSLPDYFERLKTLGIQLELEGDEKWVG